MFDDDDGVFGGGSVGGYTDGGIFSKSDGGSSSKNTHVSYADVLPKSPPVSNMDMQKVLTENANALAEAGAHQQLKKSKISDNFDMAQITSKTPFGDSSPNDQPFPTQGKYSGYSMIFTVSGRFGYNISNDEKIHESVKELYELIDMIKVSSYDTVYVQKNNVSDTGLITGYQDSEVVKTDEIIMVFGIPRDSMIKVLKHNIEALKSYKNQFNSAVNDKNAYKEVLSVRDSQVSELESKIETLKKYIGPEKAEKVMSGELKPGA